MDYAWWISVPEANLQVGSDPPIDHIKINWRVLVKLLVEVFTRLHYLVQVMKQCLHFFVRRFQE